MTLRGALTGGRRDKRHGVYPSVKEDAFEALIEPKRHRAAVAAFMNSRELDRAITDAEAKVQDFSDMVSKYPDMKPMREQLAKAQAELAQLHSDRDNWSPAHFLPPDEVLRRGLMAMLRRKQANSDGSISFDVHPDEDPAAVLREIELMEKGKHPLMDQLTADDAVKVLLADDRYWEENHGEDIRLAVHHVTVNGITKEVVDVVPLWD